MFFFSSQDLSLSPVSPFLPFSRRRGDARLGVRKGAETSGSQLQPRLETCFVPAVHVSVTAGGRPDSLDLHHPETAVARSAGLREEIWVEASHANRLKRELPCTRTGFLQQDVFILWKQRQNLHLATC